MSFELDINNYELQDLLNLFGLQYDYSTLDLKNAKKIVLKTHPDKSKLPKEYFLFYSKAYKVLHSMYEFRGKNDSNITDYAMISNPQDEEQLLVDNIKDKESFRKWFHQMFDQMKVHDEEDDNGYGEWLKGNENVCNNEPCKMDNQEFQRRFNQQKDECRDIVRHSEICDVNVNISCGSTSIERNTIGNYGNSDIFAKLQFNDLKDAHVNSCIPVSERDYQEREQHSSLFELKKHRDQQKMNIPSLQQSHDYLKNKKYNEDVLATTQAYKFAKEAEIMNQKTRMFWSKLKLLE